MGNATKRRYRIANQEVVIGKERLVEVMCELEPGKTKKAASKEYDNVTRALNGILSGYARALPKGLHVRILLRHCCSLHLCWLSGKPGRWADYPRLWVSAARRLRGRLQDLRIAEYKRWKARQNPGGQGDL